MENLKQFLRFYCVPWALWPFCILLFVLLIPICLIVFIVRSIERLIYRALYSARLFPYSDIVWTMGIPENQLYINCCLVVDGVFPINDFRKLIEECLIKSEDSEGNLLYWKATKRIHPGFINYYWLTDETFDIEDHVYELPTSIITSETKLHDVISKHRSKQLLFINSSPWEFVLIPYQVGDLRKTVIFCRLSHAIADGSALAYFLINKLAQYQQPCAEQKVLQKFSQVRPGFTKVDRFLMNMKGIWTIPAVQADFLLSWKDSNMLHVNRATGNKTITWTNPIDLLLLKGIKNRLNTTINDVMLGCLATCLSDFFNENNAVCPSEVSVIFPFDVRATPDEAKDFENKVAVMIIRLSTRKMDLISSIQETKRRLNYVKTSGEPIGSFVCWKFMSFLLPRFMSKFFIFNTVNKTTGSITNLVGPQQTVTIGGHPLEVLAFWSPQTSHHSFGISFCSYNGHIRMGIETDDAVLNNHKRIANLFEENINKLACLPDDNPAPVVTNVYSNDGLTV